LTHSPTIHLTSFFHAFRTHPNLHSFPTRRSSDLEIISANANGGAFRNGLLFFEPEHEDAIYQTLRIKDYKNILKDWEIEDIILQDRKSTRLNSSHVSISYAVFCLKKKR